MNQYQWLSGYDSVEPPDEDTERGDMMSEANKPVKLDLWAVPVAYGDGYVGVIAPEGTDADSLRTWQAIVERVNGYKGDTAFDTPQDVADKLQRLLRNLGEGKVGR